MRENAVHIVDLASAPTSVGFLYGTFVHVPVTPRHTEPVHWEWVGIVETQEFVFAHSQASAHLYVAGVHTPIYPVTTVL